MFLGVIISTISAFFILNKAQIYFFGLGCIFFIVGASLRFKEVKNELQKTDSKEFKFVGRR